jgi:hypothetical protein
MDSFFSLFYCAREPRMAPASEGILVSRDSQDGRSRDKLRIKDLNLWTVRKKSVDACPPGSVAGSFACLRPVMRSSAKPSPAAPASKAGEAARARAARLSLVVQAITLRRCSSNRRSVCRIWLVRDMGLCGGTVALAINV